MKDNTMRHFSDFDGEEMLLIYEEEDNIIFVISNMDIFEPQKQIRFRKESIKEIIEDLNQLIK